MKTLVVVTHPRIETSIVNKRWVEELRKHSEQFTVHELHRTYPDGMIDAPRERALIESHGPLVLQFPVYWFNCPPLLKTWLDDVFVEGWAFGRGGNKLEGRKIALAVSAGITEDEYRGNGRYRHTLEEVLVPFSTTLIYVGADYRSFFPFYGAEGDFSPELVDESARRYVEFLEEI